LKGISVEVNQGEMSDYWDQMEQEKQLLLYDSWVSETNSGNIYLDDLNITDYPMYKRAQQGRLPSSRSFSFRNLALKTIF
jgi:lipopolysaccharide export system ATP-binding protein